MSRFNFCMKPALWKNTKKPTGNYCAYHKEVLEGIFPDDWVLLNDPERSLCLCAESNSWMRKEKQMEDNAAENTDKEIWRKVKDDFYSPSIHVTESGSIGINVGGSVIVAPVEKWHEVFNNWTSLLEELRKMIKEVLKEEGIIDEIITGIFKASEKSGFDCFEQEKGKKIKVNIEADNMWLAGLTGKLLEEIYAKSKEEKNDKK